MIAGFVIAWVIATLFCLWVWSPTWRRFLATFFGAVKDNMPSARNIQAEARLKGEQRAARESLTPQDLHWYDQHIKLASAVELPEMEKVRHAASVREEEVRDLPQDVPAHGSAIEALHDERISPTDFAAKWVQVQRRCDDFACCIGRYQGPDYGTPIVARMASAGEFRQFAEYGSPDWDEWHRVRGI